MFLYAPHSFVHELGSMHHSAIVKIDLLIVVVFRSAPTASQINLVWIMVVSVWMFAIAQAMNAMRIPVRRLF